MKVALLAVLVGFIAQATPPRDTPATRSTGSAVIRGRITSAATGQPLHRVRVTLNAAMPNPPSAVTDTRGDYEITGLPAGSYTLTSARSGYLTLQYGQRRPGEAGRVIQVKDGQTVDRIDMALVRGGVLGGVITDDVGDAYPGVRVEALEFRYLRGRRLLVQAASATTNDLGQYRIGGLSPGTYVVRASSTDTWESDDGSSTHAYAVTYFPGVTGMDQAERVTLAIGQDLRNFNFATRQGRAATITGVMQTPAGEPLAAQAISVSRVIRGVGDALFANGGPGGGRGRSDESGAFQITGLPPGEYVVNSGDDAVSVTVSDGDSKHVILAARKPGTASGIVTTDEGTPPPFQANRLRVIPVDADPEAVLQLWTASGPTLVGRDGTFRMTRMNGSYLFRVSGLPPEWMLAAVTLNGKPFIDTPLAVMAGTPDVANIQLVLSRKGGRVDGQVVDSNNNPTSDATVVLFSVEAARWTIASRFVHAARPDSAGRFSVSGLPAGAYRVVAREFVPDGQWEDSQFLAGLVAGATRVDVGEAETATVTLKVQQ